MSLEVILVFVILGATIILFITEFFPIDKIAFALIGALALLGLTSPEEAISGFSNPATITVLCLMIIAIGLEENGVIEMLTHAIKRLKILPLILVTPLFMIISATISSFISTTAVVIIFIKIVSQLSERFNFSLSRLLMPISFAGILGGSCTLMGTSTNLLVNSISEKLGAERFSFFEFSLYGLVFLAIGIVFISIASKWLPKEKHEIDTEYELNKYIYTLSIAENSEIIGKSIGEIEDFDENSIKPLKLIRDGKVIHAPGKYINLKEGDYIIVMSDLEHINAATHDKKFSIPNKKDVSEEIDSNKEAEVSDLNKLQYVEVLILPGSNLIGKTLGTLRNISLEGAYPIAIQKRRNIRNTKERLLRKSMDKIRTKPGDRILLEMQENDIAKLHNLENIAILNQHEYKEEKSTVKKTISFSILLGVIALASTGLTSILLASIAGVTAMLLTKSISLEEIYTKINWQIIFLLAGMIPLGIAMNNTGTDVWISEQLLTLFSNQKPIIILGLLFGFTMLLSGTISNNATAIIMTPIAISIASGLNLPLKPFILAVMFAANFSFFTPVGYQTNALIYGTGVYKFKHFLLIGGLLSIILWIVATLLLSTLLVH
ncbi:MAG: SLC13 family permease [Alteromonas sp.]|nr:SLC13 family permease [Alteromonas sp.]